VYKSLRYVLIGPERIQYSKVNDTQTATAYGVYVKWCEIADLVDVIANILVFFI